MSSFFWYLSYQHAEFISLIYCWCMSFGYISFPCVIHCWRPFCVNLGFHLMHSLLAWLWNFFYFVFSAFHSWAEFSLEDFICQTCTGYLRPSERGKVLTISILWAWSPCVQHCYSSNFRMAHGFFEIYIYCLSYANCVSPTIAFGYFTSMISIELEFWLNCSPLSQLLLVCFAGDMPIVCPSFVKDVKSVCCICIEHSIANSSEGDQRVAQNFGLDWWHFFSIFIHFLEFSSLLCCKDSSLVITVIHFKGASSVNEIVVSTFFLLMNHITVRSMSSTHLFQARTRWRKPWLGPMMEASSPYASWRMELSPQEAKTARSSSGTTPTSVPEGNTWWVHHVLRSPCFELLPDICLFLPDPWAVWLHSHVVPRQRFSPPGWHHPQLHPSRLSGSGIQHHCSGRTCWNPVTNPIGPTLECTYCHFRATWMSCGV